jgi:integrase
MRGSPVYQVQQLFEKSGINQIGESKHQAKEAARADGAKTWHDLGKNLGIHSYATADAYRAVWREVLRESRAEYGVRDIEKLTGEHVQHFLEGKIAQGVSMATFRQYAAACEKLEVALNMYAERNNTGNTYRFSEAIETARGDARELRRFEGSRAYENPTALIREIAEPEHRLCASIQYEGGARIREAGLIRPDQLRGMDGNRGTIHIDRVGAKGGKEREIHVSRETYERLQDHIARHGVFQIDDQDKYRQSLKAAAERTGQEYHGSHGLRWNFAQERMDYHMNHGLSYEASLVAVSDEMGHVRGDITEHYLK